MAPPDRLKLALGFDGFHDPKGVCKRVWFTIVPSGNDESGRSREESVEYIVINMEYFGADHVYEYLE